MPDSNTLNWHTNLDAQLEISGDNRRQRDSADKKAQQDQYQLAQSVKREMEILAAHFDNGLLCDLFDFPTLLGIHVVEKIKEIAMRSGNPNTPHHENTNMTPSAATGTAAPKKEAAAEAESRENTVGAAKQARDARGGVRGRQLVSITAQHNRKDSINQRKGKGEARRATKCLLNV